MFHQKAEKFSNIFKEQQQQKTKWELLFPFFQNQTIV